MTLGDVVLNRAGGLWCTRILVETWVDASCRDTGRVLGAVLVDSALDPHALDVGVSFKTRWAAASGLVVGGVALGVACTRVVCHTSIQALSVCTNFGIFTFAV